MTVSFSFVVGVLVILCSQPWVEVRSHSALIIHDLKLSEHATDFAGYQSLCPNGDMVST